jgi:hypothetical protein
MTCWICKPGQSQKSHDMFVCTDGKQLCFNMNKRQAIILQEVIAKKVGKRFSQSLRNKQANKELNFLADMLDELNKVLPPIQAKAESDPLLKIFEC